MVLLKKRGANFMDELKDKKQEEQTLNEDNSLQEEQIPSENPEPQEDAYEEPTWEETHEDVPDVVDGGSTEESLEEQAEAEQEEELPAAPEEEVEQPQEKMLTQSQVNDLVGRARQEGRMSAMKELLERYGVGDESELNDVFGRGQAYDSLNDEFTNTSHLYNEVMAENALLKTQVDTDRWEDVKLILGGKGLDITEENINALLPSHPEWKQQALESPAAIGPEGMDNPGANTPQQPSIMHKLGEDTSPQQDEEDEETRVRKWYGI